MREPRTALLAGLPAPRTAGDRKFAAACAWRAVAARNDARINRMPATWRLIWAPSC